MKHEWTFGCALALQLLTQVVKCEQGTDGAELTNYSVLNILQNVRQLHHYDQLVFAHNRNATLGSAFVAQTQTELEEPEELVDYDNFRLSANADYEEQFIRKVMSELAVPIIYINELSAVQLRQHFRVELLLLVYLEESLEAQSGLFKTVATSMKHRTLSNILFLINNDNTTATCDELYLEQLFQFCWQSKMINVAALCSDYKRTKQFYSYTHFPVFALEFKPLNALQLKDESMFPDRLHNLHEFEIPYVIGGREPRIIIYEYNGKQILGGSVGHFFITFAAKHNFKFYEPPNLRFTPGQQLVEAVRNNTAEISIGLAYPNIPLDGFSYPYEQVNWCVWSPVEADIPNYDFFWIVFEGMTFALAVGVILLISVVLSCALWQHDKKPDLLRFFIHDACLRGVLGQSFRELSRAPFVIRFIYLQICVLGILLTTSYNAYFATYWTSAPKVAPLRNIDDILYSNRKIFVFAPEYIELIARAADLRKYIPMFYVEKDYKTFLSTRDTFNTKYLYMVPTTNWQIYNEQQKVFTTPLFRLRTDMCFYNNVPMCFPIHSNSIFSQILQDMILRTAQAGLTEYWRRSGFLEMLKAGRVSLKDLSRRNEFRAMAVEDMKYVWMGYGTACAIMTTVFLAELCYFRRKHAMAFFVEKIWRRICGKKKL
ncbi:uncharacterized protein LOC126751080 [Bactrocera neohumeralis]|uniref:uncharacterized protein LOC126751080 n=1 Tax=Bactrocera neohumeralis TaxID=98809 RepID=UPI00216502EE|nr:uncharacterized protein LOC126751080 [Bactrocera neohumeralis]